jgi:anti-anti-sigma factor
MPAAGPNTESFPGSGFSITVSDGAGSDGAGSDRHRAEGRVVVTGELDLLTSPQLQETLTELMRKGSVGCVVADLTRVTFFDSSALNVLLQLQRQAAEQKVAFMIAPSRQVRRVMELAGVSDHLELVENSDS